MGMMAEAHTISSLKIKQTKWKNQTKKMKNRTKGNIKTKISFAFGED